MGDMNDKNWHGGILLYTALLIAWASLEKQKETAALIYSKPPYQLCGFAWEMICPSAVFSFPRCGGRCFLLIYHKHKLQMLHKCPRCLWFRQKNRLNCYKARTFQKFFEKWRKKRGSTRRPADPIRLFHRPHLFNQGLLFLSADCPYRQDQFHSEQYQNEQSHFQNREFVRHYISCKSSYTHFSASKDGSRKPNDQRRQCCKERIAQPLTDVHFT